MKKGALKQMILCGQNLFNNEVKKVDWKTQPIQPELCTDSKLKKRDRAYK